MGNNIKFSVIIPVYNVEKYLKKCLDSLINQTFKDLEFICINDGSTDNSPIILEEYARIDSRIKVVNQKNQGQGVARNNGIQLAQGEYISFVDPDDWVETQLYEALSEFLEEHKAEVLLFDFSEYFEQSETLKEYNTLKRFKKRFNYDLSKKNYYSWKDCKDRCLTRMPTLCWNKVYSKKFLIDNDIKFAENKFGEDGIFSHKVLFSASQIFYIHKYLYYYRHRASSETNKPLENISCIFENHNLTKDFLIEKSLFKVVKKDYSRYIIKKAISGYNNDISVDKRAEFKNIVKKYLTPFEYLKFLLATEDSFIAKIFSVKNKRVNSLPVLQIYLLGFCFSIKKM